MLSFDSYSLWLNVVIFAAASGVIWFAGVHLERYADVIARRTGLGYAFTGVLLLAGATSLPEVATTVTAVAYLNNPTLAVHNLLGGVALQTLLLVVADRGTVKAGALTGFTPHFVLLIQGVGVILLLQLAMAGIAAEGFPSLPTVGAWPVLILLAWIGVMYVVFNARRRPRWVPTGSSAEGGPEYQSAGAEETVQSGAEVHAAHDRSAARHSMSVVWLLFGGASLLVLAGGWIAAQAAEVLAEQTGLGHAFLGATLLALATSLPELSTTLSASRHGRYSMAVSNIFGSNAFDISLIFLADLFYQGGTVLKGAETSLLFVAAVGGLMTCIYLWGLLERWDRTLLGIGWDSAAALVLYVAAMAVLFHITS